MLRSKYWIFRAKILLSIVALITAVSCQESSPPPDDAEVFAWGKATLTSAVSQTDRLRPKFFETARIPNDFEYKKTGKDFGEEEFKKISESNANFLRDVGIVSALAEYCKLPWNENNFLPMMQWQRTRLPDNERNGLLTYQMAVSHGYAMGITDDVLEHWKPNCDQLKTDLDGKLFADVFKRCRHARRPVAVNLLGFPLAL